MIDFCKYTKCILSIIHVIQITLTFYLDIHTRATFILVVEKDATFQHLLNYGFCEDFHPCILITVSYFWLFIVNKEKKLIVDMLSKLCNKIESKIYVFVLFEIFHRVWCKEDKTLMIISTPCYV